MNRVNHTPELNPLKAAAIELLVLIQSRIMSMKIRKIAR
jgi:hypothetical protein